MAVEEYAFLIFSSYLERRRSFMAGAHESDVSASGG
jgi:hypothetical protein